MIEILACTVGGFFILARFRWFYDPSKSRGARWLNAERRDSLRRKMEFCGYQYLSGPIAAAVAAVEVLGGAAMMVPATRPYAAPAILALLLGATFCTAGIKVREQNPVDRLDMVAAYLWRVEGLYILMTALVVWADWGA